MSYAIKIPNVNFADVSVGKITYIEPVPCTGISLSVNSLSFDTVGEQKTIIATLTPSDTTDELVWSTSDDNIATVENGTVTIHGIGSVTITATCGAQTASLTVNQTMLKAPYQYTTVSGFTVSNITYDNKKYLGRSSLSSQSYGGQPYHNTDDLRIKESTPTVECIRVPYGSTYVNVDINTLKPNYIEVVDTTSLVTADGLNYPEWIKNKGFPFANGAYAVEYGQAFAFRGTTANIEDVNYVYFT